MLWLIGIIESGIPMIDRERDEYGMYLRRFFWFRIMPTLIGAFFGAMFFGVDLYQFSHDRSYIFHPWLSIFGFLGCVGIGCVAIAATWTITRQTGHGGTTGDV